MLLLWSPWLPNPSSSPRIDSVMDINSKASLKGNCVHKTLKDKRLYCKKQIWSGEIEMHTVIANCNEDPMWSYDLLRLSRLNCLPYRSQNITWRPPDTVLPWLLYKLTRIPWLEISFGTNNWLYRPFEGCATTKNHSRISLWLQHWPHLQLLPLLHLLVKPQLGGSFQLQNHERLLKDETYNCHHTPSARLI